MTAAYTLNPSTSTLIIHTDGGARGNPGPAATGIVILGQDSSVITEFGTYLGETTNNVAEYTAVIEALKWLKSHRQEYPPSLQLSFKLDSNLVVEQLSRRWKIKEGHLFALAQEAWQLLQSVNANTTFAYIPRAQNAAADRQVNLVLDSQLQ